MTKPEFLEELKSSLSGLPDDEIKERLSFYSEIIDDRIEEGITEEDAVLSLGKISDIVTETIADTPLKKIVKKKVEKKRTIHLWEIVLIILGAPLWVPIIISLLTIALSLYAVIWALVISLCAVEVSLFACTLCSAFLGIFYIIKSNLPACLASFSLTLFCIGLSIIMFYICLMASKATIRLTKKFILTVKMKFVKEGNLI